jgi:hypothetical protein
MARPQDAGVGDDLQNWSVAANILNVTSAVPPARGLGVGLNPQALISNSILNTDFIERPFVYLYFAKITVTKMYVYIYLTIHHFRTLYGVTLASFPLQKYVLPSRLIFVVARN